MKAPGPAQNGKYRIVAEINMIPFIDIALVLLIIFMVMTPFLIRAQINVNLPEASQVQSEPDRADAVTVQVEKNGTLSVDGKRVPREGLADSLKRLLHHPLTQPVIIEADRDVPFQHVVVVLDAGKKIGASKLAVCVKPENNRRGAGRP
jgi:biopolymer transport protein ExbD